jgi:hypothetical protein
MAPPNSCLLALAIIFALGLTIRLSIADEQGRSIDSPSQMVCKVLQDPKTKVIFYLESDRHHLSAISPKGALLWQIDTWSHLAQDQAYMIELYKNKSVTIEQAKVSDLINFIDLCKSDVWLPKPYGNPDGYLSVQFNSNVSGLIRKSTGEVIPLMRN